MIAEPSIADIIDAFNRLLEALQADDASGLISRGTILKADEIRMMISKFEAEVTNAAS